MVHHTYTTHLLTKTDECDLAVSKAPCAPPPHPALADERFLNVAFGKPRTQMTSHAPCHTQYASTTCHVGTGVVSVSVAHDAQWTPAVRGDARIRVRRARGAGARGRGNITHGAVVHKVQRAK